MPRPHIVASILILALTAACSRDKSNDFGKTIGETANAAATKSDTSAMANMPGMSNMTGNPDHDFLRMMSDHHKGLTLLAHEAVKRTDAVAVKEDARKMDRKQDAELDTMMTMLSEKYKDDYTPMVMASNQATADSLMKLPGSTYARGFLQAVISHHTDGIRMMDEYLPKLSDPAIKAMAQRMRNDQQKEVAQLRAKLAGIK